MLKKLIIAAAVLIPLAIIAVVVMAFYSLNHGVKVGIEKFGPRFTGTAVTVESVRLSPLTGSGTIRGLQVANPEGFKTPYAFRLDEVSLSLDVGSVMSEEVVVHEVRVIGPDVIYEQGLTGSNVGKLRKTVEEKTGSGDEAVAPEKEGPKVIIEKFVMSNGKIRLGTSLSEKTVSIDMPTVELNDVGRGDGATVADTVRELTVAVTGTVINVVAASGKLTEAAAATVEKAVETVEEVGKKTVDGVKKLFQRD